MILLYDPSVMKNENKTHVYNIQENMFHLFMSEEELNKTYDPKSDMAITTLALADFKLVINIEKPPKKTQ